MDFQEAKYITLWKLALTYGEGGKVPEIYHSRTDPRRRERFWVEQMDMDDSSRSCAFCQVGLSIIASGIANYKEVSHNECDYCPIDGLCDEWRQLNRGKPLYHRYHKQALRRIFNKLLALPMPKEIK